jgi:arylamine N-acetyltransferase
MDSNSLTLPDPASFHREVDQFLEGLPRASGIPPLQEIASLSAYFSRLPFENISKLLKTEKALDLGEFRLPNEILEDHLRWHLGGTCYSLTYFLMGILQNRGFMAEPLLCHMNWGANAHTAVLVTWQEQRYLVDPGYLVHQPIPLRHQTIRRHRRSMEGLELVYDEEQDQYTLFTYRNGQFTRRYWFQDKPVDLPEYARRWQESFSAPLMNGICITQVTPDEMIYIHNDYLKITRADEVVKQRDQNQVEQIIAETFQIPLEILEEARGILARKAGV